MDTLPIDKFLPDLETVLKDKGVAIVVSPPGSGKTTRIPPAVTRWVSGQTLLLQPRRVAVRSSVQRIADEQGWQLGQEIGYQIRFEKKLSKESRLVAITEGILTQRLTSDPYLQGVDCVILDEFHERSLHTDFALAWLKQIRKDKRPDLLLIVMSATLDAQAVSNFLDQAVIIQSQGQIYPVETHFSELSVPYQKKLQWAKHLALKINKAVEQSAENKSILVFLPGVGEIEAVFNELRSLVPRLHIVKLYGRLSSKEQDLALKDNGIQRVVLATNVAETSLTVEGVQIVVDSGLERVLTYDPDTGIEKLQLQRISKASAQQRSGRSGRLGPGICYKIWTQAEERKMAEYLPPEIERVDLAGWLLTLKTLPEIELAKFEWFHNPRDAAMKDAERCLRLLDFVGEDNQITELGRWAARLPLDPRNARLLMEGYWNKGLEWAAFAVALISEGDFLKTHINASDYDVGECDIDLRWHIFEDARHFGSKEIDFNKLKSIEKLQQHLMKSAQRMLPNKANAISQATIPQQWLLHAYVDRLCRRREKQRFKAKMFGGRGVQLDKSSVVEKSPLYIGIKPMEFLGKSEGVINMASRVLGLWVENKFKTHVTEQSWLEERKNQAAKFYRAKMFFDIPIEKPRLIPQTKFMKREMQLSGWIQDLPSFFREFPVLKTWTLRVNLLNKYQPQYEFPSISEVDIANLLKMMLAESSEAPLDLKEFCEMFEMLLSPIQVDLLAQLAPTHWKHPSGRTREIEYREALPPLLLVKIQEMFGITDHPSIAAGGLPLQLALLTPNLKPIQTTSDINGFWQGSYQEVRKEFKIRYHRHAWPEDPIAATPEFKGRISR